MAEAEVDVKVVDTPQENDGLAITTSLPLPKHESPTGGTFERRGIRAWQSEVDGVMLTYFFADGQGDTRLRKLLAGAGATVFDNLIEALRSDALYDKSSAITVAQHTIKFDPDNDVHNVSAALANAWNYVTGEHTADDDRADDEDRAAAAEGYEIVETDTRD
ncbi:MAG TPA: hypothetical protein VLG92_03970 [Candidatus Saccharimonadia bacterium]|nr:hypothetical protein [Candidatus Saccharimonadia bacterium]